MFTSRRVRLLEITEDQEHVHSVPKEEKKICFCYEEVEIKLQVIREKNRFIFSIFSSRELCDRS